MNIDRRFECATRRIPKQVKWTSIKESELKALKARSELLDEATGLRSELYAALGVLILATPTGNYRNDLTDLNIRFMEYLRKLKELSK